MGNSVIQQNPGFELDDAFIFPSDGLLNILRFRVKLNWFELRFKNCYFVSSFLTSWWIIWPRHLCYRFSMRFSLRNTSRNESSLGIWLVSSRFFAACHQGDCQEIILRSDD